jgi:hypothetical protein
MLFVVSARAGQYLIVNIVPGPSREGFATSGTFTSPSGAADGGPGGLAFDADLTETGDYTIRVARNLMASNTNGGAFTLEVVIR